MSKIYQGTLDFAVDAYGQLKDIQRDDPMAWRSCWHEKRGFDEQSILQFLMLRRDSYYGEWALYEHGSFVCTFDGTMLATLYEAKEAARKARSEALKEPVSA